MWRLLCRELRWYIRDRRHFQPVPPEIEAERIARQVRAASELRRQLGVARGRPHRRR